MFAKVFEQIFDSSIAENWKVRIVFEDLLKLADMNGVVDKTHEAIARRTNVPLDVVVDGINILEEPDPKSRRPDSDGRRIVRIDDHRDWGWLIVNYDYYRHLASEEQRRQKTKERVKRFREKQECNASVTHVNDSPSPSPSTSSSVSVLGESAERGMEAWEREFEECWALYPDKSGKSRARTAFKKAYKAGVRQEDILRGLNRYAYWINAKRGGGFKELQVQNGGTWFYQRGWEDEYSIEDKGANDGMPKFD